MNKPFFLCLSASLLLSACGAPRMPLMAFGPRLYNAAAVYRSDSLVRGTLTPSRPKEETALLTRHVTVPRSAFDDFGDRQAGRRPQPDSLYSQAARQSAEAVAGQLPFATYADWRDYVRNSVLTPFEDFKYLDETQARAHFSRYAKAYAEAQRRYGASREQMKRLMLLDVLGNSLSVENQAFSADTHHPAAQTGYRLDPVQAAQLMPSFGELVAYNLGSSEVNYSRWNLRTAARFYQANYARYFSLIMEAAPDKTDAWRLIHRELSAVAGD